MATWQMETMPKTYAHTRVSFKNLYGTGKYRTKRNYAAILSSLNIQMPPIPAFKALMDGHDIHVQVRSILNSDTNDRSQKPSKQNEHACYDCKTILHGNTAECQRLHWAERWLLTFALHALLDQAPHELATLVTPAWWHVCMVGEAMAVNSRVNAFCACHAATSKTRTEPSSRPYNKSKHTEIIAAFPLDELPGLSIPTDHIAFHSHSILRLQHS